MWGLANSFPPGALVSPTTINMCSHFFGCNFMIKEWVDQMQKELISLADKATAGKSLTEIFLRNRHLYTVEQNDADKLVDRAAWNIEQLLRKRSLALEKLATAAETFQMEHKWKDEFEHSVFRSQLDPNKTEGRIRPDFRHDSSFKRLTDHNYTAVHIPTDIYNGSTIVLNELKWTERLEEVFRRNKEDDPTLLWQVFGSATGLARYYPASPWMDVRKTPSKIDLYDVRRRPWYIQGAASPKDMLILVDASGSVSGLTLKLIRTSVSEMLETLSDDDYVNVVYFNTRVKQTACFDHLVQANVRNKKLLKDAVQNITAKGITNYTKGFEFAFQQLSATNVSRANCNKIIMLFTDGGEERAQAILERYNADKKVRIFTFSVGQHNYDKRPIQWMACSNKGKTHFDEPDYMWMPLQEYLDVLGRPMVLADQQAKQVQWTNVYLDALELGLVITGTLPVFNKTKSKDDRNGEVRAHQNQLILGVMGIDVSLKDIKKLTPRFTIGPNGYYFAIDPNGYVLLHPNLQPKNPKFQEPVTLDFLDAELENDIKVEIRTTMIDGETGERSIKTLVKSQDERYIDRGVRTYTWAPVNVAFVLERFDEFGYTYIAPREYCKELKISHNNSQFLQDFNMFIDRNTPDACNVSLVSRLILDAGLTAELVKEWKKESVDGVVARFVATDGGLPESFQKGIYWSENPEPYECSSYKRALDNEIYIFTAPIFNAEGRELVTDTGILVSKAVDLSLDEVTLKPAVVGVKLNVTHWMNSFINATLKVNCKDEICGCLRNDKHIDCVILDDGGFLLMSNQDEYISLIGQFFGEVDPVLMINLVNTSLYFFNKTYDYQSVCDPEEDSKAAAGLRSVYVVRQSVMLLKGIFGKISTGRTFKYIYSLFPVASSEEDISVNMFKESCITEQTQYYFDNDERSYSGVLDCGNCSRMYRAEKLPNTNLVFLITDAKATCLSCDPRPLRQAEQPCILSPPAVAPVAFSHMLLLLDRVDQYFCRGGRSDWPAMEAPRSGDEGVGCFSTIENSNVFAVEVRAEWNGANTENVESGGYRVTLKIFKGCFCAPLGPQHSFRQFYFVKLPRLSHTYYFTNMACLVSTCSMQGDPR
uniref:Calcium voltage-gated channel auxiliary subunit alpha2delta 1 n=1 Tax=Neogobius melanostomus TaxID=47308 RepID=A0A8C6WHM4_9GOBI